MTTATVANIKSGSGAGSGSFRSMSRFAWPAPRKLGQGLYEVWAGEVRKAELGKLDPFPATNVVIDVRVDPEAPATNLLTVLAWVHRALGDLGVVGNGHAIVETSITFEGGVKGLEIVVWSAQ